MSRAAVLGGLLLLLCLLALGALMAGSVGIPVDEFVRALFDPDRPGMAAVLVHQVRLPRMITALCAGVALSVAGLQMQTLFRNPLADPFSLGVSSGASLGVALLITGVGAALGAGFAGGLPTLTRFGTVAAAAVGAGVVMVVVLALARFVRVPATLLIIGVMVGSAVTALVSLILTWTDPQRAQQFIAWTLGSFSGTSGMDIPILVGCTLAGLLLTTVSIKSLNALLLGEAYARSVGVNVRRGRVHVLVSASLLTGVVTAFCGPIGFIGIAAPHAARRIIGTSEHWTLMPATALVGGSASLACTIISILPGQVVPINVLTSLVGAPVVVAIILRSRSIQGVTA